MKSAKRSSCGTTLEHQEFVIVVVMNKTFVESVVVQVCKVCGVFCWEKLKTCTNCGAVLEGD